MRGECCQCTIPETISMEILTEFFSKLYHFDALIRWGGYTVLAMIVFAETGLLAGFFLPGDSLLITAGLLAAVDGVLNIWTLILLLTTCTIIGDSVGYLIGHQAGPRIFNRDDSILFHKNHLERTQRFYKKYGRKTIILARFVPIIRTFAPTVAGVGKMPYFTFLPFSIMGGIGWVVTMTLAGFFLGSSIPGIEHKIHWIILVVIALSFIPIALEWRRSRSSKKEITE